MKNLYLIFVVFFISTASATPLTDYRGLILNSGTRPWGMKITAEQNGLNLNSSYRADFSEIKMSESEDFFLAKDHEFKIQAKKKNGKIKTLMQLQKVLERKETNKHNNTVNHKLYEMAQIEFADDGNIRENTLCDLDFIDANADEETYFCVKVTDEICNKLEQKGFGPASNGLEKAASCEGFFRSLNDKITPLHIESTSDNMAKSALSAFNDFSHDEVGWSMRTAYYLNTSFEQIKDLWALSRSIQHTFKACQQIAMIKNEGPQVLTHENPAEQTQPK